VDKTVFFGLELSTLPGYVMTPRRTTEQLVTAVLQRVGGRAAVVADVGTGSGAVAVAIATNAPRVHVWATDTSAEAVELARANARRHGVADRVTVCEGDLLGPVPGRVDAIVANLPYLPIAEADLNPDLDCEPAEAVFAPRDGLDPYRRLVASARDHLTPAGALMIQLRRRILVARPDELDRLAAEFAPRPRWLGAAALATA
jgi:release factor glutamine methyltransferase